VTLPSLPPTTLVTMPLPGRRSLPVDPSVGTTAWIDCAGHLPWGLSGDQRADDVRSLVWDSAPPSGVVVGHPVVRLRVSADAPAASLSVKLCDVFPDGTSALVSRGTLDLAFRESVHGAPSPLVAGEEHDVEVVLDACAYEWAPGQTLRVSVAGADWPNTVAPPAPVTLTVHEGSLDLPVLIGSHPAPSFGPGAGQSSESAEGVIWTVTDDVLAGVTRAATGSVSTYPTPYDGTTTEDYRGTVWVDRRSFEQGADATTRFALSWPGVEIEVVSTLEVRISDGEVRATTHTVASRDGSVVSDRTHQQVSR
jgi:hypothetical protein